LKIYSITGSDLDETKAWFEGLNLKNVVKSCGLGLSHPVVLIIITILPSSRLFKALTMVQPPMKIKPLRLENLGNYSLE
jgi:hypothetical protein